jgi:hypothetical protein
VDGLLPKTKGASVEAGVFGDKTPLNRRIVRSMSVAGRAEEKCIVDDEQQVGPASGRLRLGLQKKIEGCIYIIT